MKPAFYSAGFAFVGLIAFALFAPTPAAAAEAYAVQTRQLLPIGQTNACPQLQVRDVVTYVTEGDLGAFEVSIRDLSYVSIIGAAGDEFIPFNHMNRRIESDGDLRIHVDTMAQVNGGLPVTLTLLSAANNVTCMSVISFTVQNNGTTAPSEGGATPTPTTPPPSHTGGGSTGSNGGESTGGTNGGSMSGGGKPAGAGTSTATTSATSTVATSSVMTTLKDKIGSCSTEGSYRLWFILLALFFVLLGFIALGRPSISHRHWTIPGATILAALILLLLFWYFAPTCRASSWMPVILLLSAAAGLYAVYRNDPYVTNVIQLPPAQK